jgi:hypothetical protein
MAWFDPWGVVDAIAEFRLRADKLELGHKDLLLNQIYILERIEKMSEAVDLLVLQVAETKGVVESATVAIYGVIARLDALIEELESYGEDTTKLQAMRDDLASATPALAGAIAAIPGEVEPPLEYKKYKK